jgi:hypothetical protein
MTSTVTLSPRVAVRFIFTDSSELHCEWDPERPAMLTGVEHAAYIAARNSFVSALAQRVGGNIVLGDLAPDGRVAGVVCFYPDGRIEGRAS